MRHGPTSNLYVDIVIIAALCSARRMILAKRSKEWSGGVAGKDSQPHGEDPHSSSPITILQILLHLGFRQ